MTRHDDIFAISDRSQFARAAMETFRFQAERCEVYAEYLERTGVRADDIDDWRQIPMLPIGFFKWRDVYCGERPPEKVFTSSSTGGTEPARHAMRSLKMYERAFTESFGRFYGKPERWSLYCLLPSYLEREGSSLVYMCDRLIAACGSGGFYLNQYEKLLGDMARDRKPKILLGVSYALWELAERFPQPLHDTIVMETGGMKGRREELPKARLHEILCGAFGVGAIHSEYGMAELTSQAYSDGRGVFRCPPWMRVLVRDTNDPLGRPGEGERGGLDIIDLSNRWSCAFISTQDVGRSFGDGSFTVEGRIDRSDIRGCNLLVDNG